MLIHDLRITDAVFPSLDEATQQKMRSVSEDLLPKGAVPISLDRMLAGWVQTAHSSTANGTIAGARTSAGGAVVGGVGPGGSGFVGKDQNNNLYAGKDGNVYKKDASGSWQKYGNGGWSGANPPATQYNSTQSPQQRAATQQRTATQQRAATQARATTQPGAATQTRPATQPTTPTTRPGGTSDGSSPRPARPAAVPSPSPSAPTRNTPQNRPSTSQQPPAAANPMQQLDRDAAARQRGSQQAQQYQKNRQSGTAGSAIGNQPAAGRNRGSGR